MGYDNIIDTGQLELLPIYEKLALGSFHDPRL